MVRSGFNRPVAAIAHGEGAVTIILAGAHPPTCPASFGQLSEASSAYDQN